MAYKIIERTDEQIEEQRQRFPQGTPPKKYALMDGGLELSSHDTLNEALTEWKAWYGRERIEEIAQKAMEEALKAAEEYGVSTHEACITFRDANTYFGKEES